MSPIGMVYGNAEVRGRLRVWKQQLAQHYAQFDVGYESLRDGKLKSIPQDLVKCTRGGRERALAAIRRAVGPGATLEATYLNGRLALFSILKPRSSVICETHIGASESERASLLQDCINEIERQTGDGRAPGRPRRDRDRAQVWSVRGNDKEANQ